MNSQYFAEFETDRYIRDNFIPEFDYKGIMIEVGAGPTDFYSMSRHFRNNGWRCICIDPNPKFVEMHKSEGNEIYQYACSFEDKKSNFNIVSSGWPDDKDGISYSSLGIKYDIPEHKIETIEVDVIKLNTLLENINIEKIDFLSIDTEGWELEVMKGFDTLKYNPKLILLENYTHDNSYIDYMESMNYSLHSKIHYNYIFIKKS